MSYLKAFFGSCIAGILLYLAFFLWYLPGSSPYGFLTTQSTVTADRGGGASQRSYTLSFRSPYDGMGMIETYLRVGSQETDKSVIFTLYDDVGRQIHSSTYTLTAVTGNKLVTFGLPTGHSADRNYLLRIQWENPEGSEVDLDPARELTLTSFWDTQSVVTSLSRLAQFVSLKVSAIHRLIPDVYKYVLPALVGISIFTTYVIYKLLEGSWRMRRVVGRVIHRMIVGLIWVVQHIWQIIVPVSFTFFRSVMRIAHEVIFRIKAEIKKQQLTYGRIIEIALVYVIFSLTNLVFVWKLLPVSDRMYLVWIISYATITFMLRPSPRIHYFTALIHLLFCPYLLSILEEDMAEKVAVFVYFYLCAGAIADFVESRKRMMVEEWGEQES